LLERQQKSASPDPLAERVLASSKSDPRWLGRIASFGLGLTSADELRGFAKNPAQKTEAAFYGAMTKRAAGDSAGANEALKQVMSGGGLELIEVALARDMLDDNRAVAFGPLPDVSLP
jgi:hypothetical protein